MKLGCDPEICVVDNNGQVVPSGWCFDVWGETREVIPAPLSEPDAPPKGRKLLLADGIVLYEDGASMEFNLPPTESPEQMVAEVGEALQLANQLVEEAGFHLEIKASLPITEDVLKRGGVTLSRFGCDPDSTPWDDPYDPSRIDATTCFNRFYGGHIHIENPSDDEDFLDDRRWEMTVVCDLLLGLSDVLFDHSSEAATRRQVYGRIGRNRMQFYKEGQRGYEYRVPSNVWMTDPQLCRFVFSMAKVVGYVVLHDNLYQELVNTVNLVDLKNAINLTDADLAGRLWVQCVLPFMSAHEGFLPPVNYTLPLLHDPTDWREAWNIPQED